MTLTEFLLARIGEDEVMARRGFSHTERWVVVAVPGMPDGIPDGWSTKTVLAECEAKRRIAEHHSRIADPSGDPLGDLCGICSETGPDAQGWPCLTLRLLALSYADHSDYRQEWKP